MHVEGLLPADLCLVTLLSSEQSPPFGRFRLPHFQMFNFTMFEPAEFPLQTTARLILGKEAGNLPLIITTQADFGPCNRQPTYYNNVNRSFRYKSLLNISFSFK